MKLSLLTALLASAVTVAAPVNTTDSIANAYPISEGDDGSCTLKRRDFLWNEATFNLEVSFVRMFFPPAVSDPGNWAEDLGGFVKYTHDHLREDFPNANIFIYHRFQKNSRFRWKVSDPNAEEGEIFHATKKSTTEYWKVVVFHSDGYLKKSGDGGFENWIFSGKYHREGDNIYFEAP